MNPEDRIIIALDVSDAWRAQSLILEIPQCSIFKVGHHVIWDEDFIPNVIDHDYWENDRLSQRANPDFFVDFKYLDIPNTDSAAVFGLIKRRRIKFCTVHAARSVMNAAVEAANAWNPDLRVLAVPVLTSFDAAEIKEFYGWDGDLLEFVEIRVQRAIECGCHGTICPPEYVAAIRRQVPDDFLIVVPGIRSEGSDRDDHQNPGTPKQVIGNGADYIVVGRSIGLADDPREAFEKIVEEIS
jgi:orotidine-5'-phosphate decarboxylase